LCAQILGQINDIAKATKLNISKDFTEKYQPKVDQSLFVLKILLLLFELFMTMLHIVHTTTTK